MSDILQMNDTELRGLNPRDVRQLLAPDEVIHIAKTLGAFWCYDYEAAKIGKVGKHALLKSGQHSDGFFFSKILLEPENIRHIFARQMAALIMNLHVGTPQFIAGVPDGATALGQDIAQVLRTQNAAMLKINGEITLLTHITKDKSVLVVEDFCTWATGFREAVEEIRLNASFPCNILPYSLVIINRGGMKSFFCSGQKFTIVPIVEKRIQDWVPEKCPLCALGSVPVKPKATDENWQALITSQL